MYRFLIAAFLFFSSKASSQTLFTYGKDSVSVKEFMQAFHKNNAGKTGGKALQDYLHLYIASRLKIREARERGYDTLPQLVADMENLRAQITPAYERDEETLNRLAEEALARSQKDIHLAHIFIGFTNAAGLQDSTAALKKANEALSLLQKGNNFSDVARKFSDDPSVKENGGDLGFITVFDLPYELENLAYTTATAKLSPVYKSKAGYHLFKNLEERNALGRMKAAQILLAFPPDADAAQKQYLKKLADSLYNRLQKGDDFSVLASQFSNDPVSSAANGAIPEFGIGQFDPLFENTVYGMKDGTISKPFLTSHGYHIVKRISRVPVAAIKTEEAIQTIKERMEQSDRINLTREVLAQKAMKMANIKIMPFQASELWAYTDSLIDYKRLASPVSLTTSSPLFQLGKNTITVSEWINFAQTFRYKPDGSGMKPYSQVWDDFLKSTAYEYYKANLETFNPTFAGQMNEFEDGTLFFEIMQREVWGPAQTDSTALQQYFQKNKTKYAWNKSADAVIFYSSDQNVAQLFSAQLKKSPAKWKELVQNLNDQVTADSARFELSQIPNATKGALKAGSITTPVVSKTDRTSSFAYVIRLYTKPAQRNFEEARGLVINDYQAQLEREWLNKLKAKYPVKLNEAVWASVLKGR